MVKAVWGRKITCHKCGAKYYDMKSKDIKCPKCDAAYKVEKVKTRRATPTDTPKPAPEKPVEQDSEGEVIEVDLDDEILGAEDDKSQDDTIIEDATDISGDDEDIEEVVGVVNDSEVKE